MSCEREIARKDERRIEMTLKLARFPFVRDLAGFDFAAQPSIDPKQVRDSLAHVGCIASINVNLNCKKQSLSEVSMRKTDGWPA